jgi:broad specificity phosphatase PhoE
MPADRIHLIRHGEVHNPDQVLYGRLPHFRLSERGHEMAELAARELKHQKRQVSRLISSPLLRTRESAEHVQDVFGVTPTTDQRLIEPFNVFEGRRLSAGHIALRPHLFFHLRNPKQPSWGEPYEQILERMLSMILEANESVVDGDVVLVTHQLPIVMVQRHLSGFELPHSPKNRRCALSSITTVQVRNGKVEPKSYIEPAAALHAVDSGAV